MFTINGPVRQFGRRLIHDTHAYGSLLVEEIISKSSNIGMGLLADRCGNGRIHEYVTRFGFGAATGIALPGEHPGILRPLEEWDSYSTQSIPIGQEIATTPLQLANALEHLPEDQQTAVELHHLAGYTMAETAEQMGRTKASVAGLLRRGLSSLREHLEQISVE